MFKKNFFAPYATWKNFFKKPTTIRYPKEELNVFDKPGASPAYRGMHTNDLRKCIGCGTCEDICPTSAVNMIPWEHEEEGKKPFAPQIDYGRCCFCGFCVDVCTSSSLNMSRDYIYTLKSKPEKLAMSEVMDKYDLFRVQPNEEHGDNIGHNTPGEEGWLDLNRTAMEEEQAETRIKSFMEYVKGFSREQALKEASRCVECGVCEETCPAHMEISQYIKAIWEDDLKKAVDIMYNTNPLPGICGRVCTHKCESVCSIGHRGEPLSIRWLKRYAVDNLQESDYKEAMKQDVVKTGKRVAIVGSGPSGLSCAYYLSLAGHEVTVFESLPQAGGMMRVGIPKYRLPNKAIDRDIQHILDLGVEIKLNTRVGKDISLEDLENRFNAVYISTGLHLGRKLGYAAEQLDGVVQSVDILRQIALGEEITIPKKLIVIGGGNVAMDIARTMARKQVAKYGGVNIDVLCLESREEIPCDEEEYVESIEEGIRIHCSYGPQEIRYEGTIVTGVDFKRCNQVFDSQGRFSPQFDEKDTLSIDADMVVESIGQGADLSYISKKYNNSLNKTPRGRIDVSENGQTSLPWLFAGGDIVRGPDAINGIADGHRAAKGIDEFLGGIK